MKKFNYCVAHYWNGISDSQIGVYETLGGAVAYGSLNDAKKFLLYVQEKSPDKKWKIFQVTEILDINQ